MDRKTREFRVKQARAISAEMTVPGDNSISHRAVILASLSNGRCEIDGFLPGSDCLRTVEAMRALGVQIDELEGDERGPVKLRVHGRGYRLKSPTEPIDCGNSATTMRLLAGLLAGMPFESRLVGSELLSRRPMTLLLEALDGMGAQIVAEGDADCAPLAIKGGPLSPMDYDLPVANAQIKGAVLLAGMLADGRTSVTEPSPLRDHTERMLRYFLVKTRSEGRKVTIYGGQGLESRDFRVPGDISSAAFWMLAAAAQRGANLTVRNVGLNLTRTGVMQVLSCMGAQISERVTDTKFGEPVGSVNIEGGELCAVRIDAKTIPNVIDELPVIAVAAAFAHGSSEITGIGELRVKEIDRVAAVAENLRAMGVTVDETYEGMTIHGGGTLHGVRVESFGDHRIAMAFAVAGLFAEGETVVSDIDCVAMSYPGFEDELKRFMSSRISEGERTPVISTVVTRRAFKQMKQQRKEAPTS